MQYIIPKKNSIYLIRYPTNSKNYNYNSVHNSLDYNATGTLCQECVKGVYLLLINLQ